MFNSARLTFSLITQDDFEQVYETLNDRNSCEIISFMRWPLTDAQVKHWCKKAEAGAKDENEYLLIARNGAEPVGCIGIHRDQNNAASAETGYWVSPRHQRQGYASEMLAAALHHAQTKLGMKSFHATTDKDNSASAHLLTKHGFVESGEITTETADGAPRPSKYFTLELP